MGTIFSRLEARFSKSSLPTLEEDSTAKIMPLIPIISEIWLTVVPVEAPMYKYFAFIHDRKVGEPIL